ncbi:WhiB family transcriptional regulator [Streptomyces sp. B21-083]|uniref:WhiB family transcriptional regulator n=1 Tax=Streptomyces sp. B21-083 TaxID=3039410 RepID=UPI002FEF86D3
MSRYDWMTDASCAQVDPDLWHDGRYAAAQRICLGCPVRPQCESHTDRLDADSDVYGQHGMWAARTRKQRTTGGGRRPAYNHDVIVRLVERGGMDDHEIANHIGCDVRTVWRAKKNHRDQQAQAVSA